MTNEKSEYASIRRKLRINVELEDTTFVTDYLIRAVIHEQLGDVYKIKNIVIEELSREVVENET